MPVQDKVVAFEYQVGYFLLWLVMKMVQKNSIFTVLTDITMFAKASTYVSK